MNKKYLKMILLFALAALSYFIFLPLILSLFYSLLYQLIPSVFVGKFALKEENLDFISLLLQDIGAIIIISIFLINLKKSKNLDKEIKKCFNKETFKHGLIVLGLLYALSFIVTILMPNIPESANQESVNNIIKLAPILSFISVVIIAPIIEELIFRFLLMTPLKEKNKYFAVAISAFIFGSIHLISSIEKGSFIADLPNLVVYVGMGAILAYKYAETDNIYTTMQGHMFNNLIAYIGALILI